MSHSRQEEEPIEIKDATQGGDDGIDIYNSSVHVETPFPHQKENDKLVPDFDCYTITLMLRGNTFNQTLSSREICTPEESMVVQSLKIPLSRYMQEDKLEILFM